MTVYLIQQKVQIVGLCEVKVLELQNTETTNLKFTLTIQDKVIVNFILRKIFRGNLNEALSTIEISSFKFPWKIFFQRKLTFIETIDINKCKIST